MPLNSEEKVGKVMQKEVFLFSYEKTSSTLDYHIQSNNAHFLIDFMIIYFNKYHSIDF